MDAKQRAAAKAVSFVKEGMVVGLGTGSTAYWAIQELAAKVARGFSVKAVATSVQTEALATAAGIPMVSFDAIQQIHITIDGADEVDKQKNLIKGGGGALTREKIVASNSQQFLVIVDESKCVEVLGKFLLPVEILPFGAPLTIKRLQGLGAQTTLRMKEATLYVTDNGHWIVDCNFYPITNPGQLNIDLHLIAGVVETGIFMNSTVGQVIVGLASGEVKVW